MTVLSALFGGGRRSDVENPLRPLTDESLIDVFGGGPTDSGVSVTHESAYQLSAVYRGISLLAGLVGAMPLHAYRREAGGGRARHSSPAISDPHPDMTAYEVYEAIGQSLFSWGNSYSFKRRDRIGRVREIEPIHPSKVWVERSDRWRTPNRAPTGKRFIVKDGGTDRAYDPWDILHIPGLSYDGLVGMSPVGLNRQNIGLGLAAEAFGARLFDRGAMIAGVLEAPDELEPEVADRLQQRWATKTTGAANHWRIPVLDAGAKFHAIGLPPEDAQYMQTRSFTVVDVARMLGLPPHLLGDVERSTSWGSGIEQQNMQMLTYTADPWLCRIEQRITREVILDSSVYVKFNRAALLRPDTAARFLAYQRAVNNGWMNADEIRGLEDMDPLPDGVGQQFFRPGNLTPMADTGQEENDDAQT